MKKQKLAPLLPSLKEKRRYLVFEVLTEGKISFEETKDAISQEFTGFLGRLYGAKAGIEFLPDWQEQKGILRVAHTYLDHAKAALALIRKINKKEVIVTSIGVSGTLNKARNKFIAH